MKMDRHNLLHEEKAERSQSRSLTGREWARPSKFDDALYLLVISDAAANLRRCIMHGTGPSARKPEERVWNTRGEVYQGCG